MTQERCWGEGKYVTVVPRVAVANAVGMEEVTLGEDQGEGAEHLRRRSGSLLPECQVEEPAGETE